MEKFYITSPSDGLRISCALCSCDFPHAVVQIVHGMAEHKERYYPFMEYLAKHGIASVINDHRGHGESVRSRGDLGWFGENGDIALVRDLSRVTRAAKSRFEDIPIFMLGHSMGALAARTFIQKYGREINGLIISGNPGANGGAKLALNMAHSRSRRNDGRNKSGLLTAMMFLPFMLGAPSFKSRNAWICTDKAVVKAYDADPLCGFTFTTNGYEALMKLMLSANAEDAPAPNPNMPVAFFSGEKDPCMNGKKKLHAAAELLKNAGYSDVSVKTYPDMRHEILNETGKNQVYADILEKIESWSKNEE